MKDAYEILKQKEEDLARVRHEVESLRIVAPLLLGDDLGPGQSEKPHLMSTDELRDILRKNKATGTDGPDSNASR